MISEVSFSRGYGSFWSEYTPWLGDFVSEINKGIASRIQNPIFSHIDDTTHRSINNTIAFCLFKNSITTGNKNIRDAYNEGITIVRNYPKNNITSYSLSDEYIEIITEISNRLINRYKNKTIEFYPQFLGCGIMESCQGDIYIENTLVEIKAGERGFQTSDIKQVITYCALNWLSEKSLNIERIEIYNPRQGILWESDLSDLVLSVSSLPLEDLFEQIGNYLSGLSEIVEL